MTPTAPRVFTWQSQFAKGQAGATALIGHLRRRGSVVVDLSEIREAQRREIDLLVDGEYVEVKTDFYGPPNVFLEVECNGKPGAVFTSRADYWLYFYVTQHTCFKFDIARLQWFVARHYADFDHKVITSRRGQSLWTASGIVVPVQLLVEEGVAGLVDLADGGAS